MSKINRFAKGLQEYFGNTAAGDNPDELSNTVAPVVDIRPFLNVDQVTYQQKVATLTSVGNGGFFTVPQGEMWMPRHLVGTLAGASNGDVIRLECALFNFGAGPRFVLHESPTYTIGADINERIATFYTWEREIIYPSGTIFGALANELQITDPSEFLTCAIQYVRLRA